MLLIALLLLAVYAGFAVWLWSGIKSVAAYHPPVKPADFTSFSVIIAAHNEAPVIGRTISALVSQNYPADLFEIIVSADRCTDRTTEVAKEAGGKFPNLKVVSIDEVPANISPKKYALQQAISRSKFDTLVLMDADCRPGEDYLQTLNHYFTNGREVVVNIPKVQTRPSLVHHYLYPERILTWGIAAAGVGHGRPFLAFGGSWAYTRQVLEAAGGFVHIAGSLSGDDDLLIYRMGRISQNIAVCLEPAGWVQTGLPESWKAFFIQRRRHHSAGKFYAPAVKAGYGIFHLSNLILFIIPFLFPLAVLALLAKFVIDYFCLRFCGNVFRESIRFMDFIIFEIGYVLQHALLAPLAFIGKIRWK